MKDEDDNVYLEALLDWVQLLMIAVFAIICAGIVYELVQPWVAYVIETWSFVP